MWSAIHSRQYDRAAKIANSEGPYITPEKEKQMEDANVTSSVFNLELNKIDKKADDGLSVEQTVSALDNIDHEEGDADDPPQ